MKAKDYGEKSLHKQLRISEDSQMAAPGVCTEWHMSEGNGIFSI